MHAIQCHGRVHFKLALQTRACVRIKCPTPPVISVHRPSPFYETVPLSPPGMLQQPVSHSLLLITKFSHCSVRRQSNLHNLQRHLADKPVGSHLAGRSPYQPSDRLWSADRSVGRRANESVATIVCSVSRIVSRHAKRLATYLSTKYYVVAA
jgi:hypothetical protein